MSDILYENVTELINQYNTILIELGIEITIHRRSFTEDVEKYNHYGRYNLFNLIEWQYKEQSVIRRVEKRLKKLLKRAENTTSSDWCSNTLWDALRYSVAKKYRYIENYCGKSRFFWEVLWICVITLPVLLFAIGGLICSIIY